MRRARGDAAAWEGTQACNGTGRCAAEHHTEGAAWPAPGWHSALERAAVPG